MLAKEMLASSFSMEEKTALKGSSVGGWVWVGECACLCVGVCEKKAVYFLLVILGLTFSGQFLICF